MQTRKLEPGMPLPTITLPTIDYGPHTLGQPDTGWELIVVYRGMHCPMCRPYIDKLHQLIPQFRARAVNVLAISADHEEKAVAFKREAGYHHLSIGYNLSLEQMSALGLYISDPHSPEETERPFAEPALFLVNPDHNLQVVNYSNSPFCRPDLSLLLEGITFMETHAYPIRGQHGR